MSETDSFIDEVSEEVRREKLFGYLRRYGWIGVLLVLLLVGGATYNEWRKGQANAAAQERGDLLVAALENETAEERAAALAALGDMETAAPVQAFLLATEQQATGDIAGAIATLTALSENETVDRDYRDLAGFKALLLAQGDDRRAGLESYAVPGQPYRMLALEQLALMAVDDGDTEAALEQLTAILEDAQLTDALRDRATSLFIALGGSPDA